MTPSELFYALFTIKDAMVSALDKATSVILCQLGNATDETPDSDAAELWGPAGYYGIPASPTKGKPSCQCVAIRQSDHDMILATRDTRDSAIYGSLKAGERCVAAGYPAQGRTIWKADGSITTYTTSDNTPSGTSVYHYVGPDKISMGNQYGAISIDSTGITITVGQAALTLTPAGVAKLQGVQTAVQGQVAAIAGVVATCLGTLSAPTPGVPGVTSVVCGATGTVGKGSQTVFCSP